MMTKRLLYFSFLIAHFSFSFASGKAQQPWTFWYWMYGAVSEEGIRADLQAMKDVGLGGCYLMPIRGAAERPEYEGQADALSENFWRMVDLALMQADSLGLDMGIHVCDGFALAGGPWITPEESMQKIVFSEDLFVGSVEDMVHRKGGLVLPRPEGVNGYYCRRSELCRYCPYYFRGLDTRLSHYSPCKGADTAEGCEKLLPEVVIAV